MSLLLNVLLVVWLLFLPQLARRRRVGLSFMLEPPRGGGSGESSAGAGGAERGPPPSAQVRVQRICMMRITPQHQHGSTANSTKPQV